MIIQNPIYFTASIPLLATTVGLSFKIPGTFAGIKPTDPTAGRFFASFWIRADSQADSDRIDTMKLIDNDGVVPVPARAALPNYPDVVQFFSVDDVTAGLTNGCWFNTNGEITIRPFDSTGDVASLFLPSGLYLEATIHGAATRSYRGNIIWGRYLEF